MLKVIRLGKVEPPQHIVCCHVGTCKACGCGVAIQTDLVIASKTTEYNCPTVFCHGVIAVAEGIVA